jgi:hypothetical protein
MTPEQLDLVLTTLKKHGVSKFRGLDLDVEMTIPVESQAGVLAKALAEIESKDKCLCGHSLANHNADGECIGGCAIEVCYPGSQPIPREDAVLTELE